MNAIDPGLSAHMRHDPNSPSRPDNITDEGPYELDSEGRFISEADVWWTELCIMNEKNAEIDDTDVRQKLLLLAAEVRRLTHKLGEYDLTLLQQDLMWGDMWVERDIARATLDPKFRAYLSTVATLELACQGYDPQTIQFSIGLSEEEVTAFGERLAKAGVLLDCPADCHHHAPF